MKKKDIILILSLAIIFCLLILMNSLRKDGQTVEITADGESYGTYLLKKDSEIDIMGTNTLIIKDNEAYMKSADCPDKLCVKSRAIKKKGEQIICLPNKVIISIR